MQFVDTYSSHTHTHFAFDKLKEVFIKNHKRYSKIYLRTIKHNTIYCIFMFIIDRFILYYALSHNFFFNELNNNGIVCIQINLYDQIFT